MHVAAANTFAALASSMPKASAKVVIAKALSLVVDINFVELVRHMLSVELVTRSSDMIDRRPQFVRERANNAFVGSGVGRNVRQRGYQQIRRRFRASTGFDSAAHFSST
jgi:hypothetical protein